uniref:Endonuclease/exonuclease/phosphatase domain-containing protein n=1 Tax=Bracon brevicornis TaxID=1563983 RepID=A0A6V7LLS2_9HYME
MPPSMTLEGFEVVLDHLVDVARGRSAVAIAGEFSTWAVEWGSEGTKKGGRVLSETHFGLDLTLLNDGQKSTFIRG